MSERSTSQTPTGAGATVSPRIAGLLLVAVPVLTGAALALFPSYDARSRYFASSFPNIIRAGNGYLAALGLFLALGGTLAVLALTLRKAPWATADEAVPVAVWGLAASGSGFATSAIGGVPVWLWARRAAEGSEPVSVLAARSEGWAAFSQTVLLFFGLAGLLVGMSALGVLALRQALIPRPLLAATAVAATAMVVIGVVTSGPVIWLVMGAFPMISGLLVGVALAVSGSLTPSEPPDR
jgi:hypothetical protein